MHMVSRKDLNSAELETVRASRNPTTVITANGEVHTSGEATVYVNDLDQFVTVQLLEDTSRLENFCEDHGYSYEWTGGQKPHLIEHERKIRCNTFVVAGLYTGSSTSVSQDPGPDDSPKTPANTRRAFGDQLRDPTETKSKNRNGRHNETCPNGWMSSKTIQWTKKPVHQTGHQQAALMSRFIQNLHPQWYRDGMACLRTSRKTEIAKYACEPR